jgi:hypothetical protein
VPTFNHTRADGPYDPCPICKAEMERLRLVIDGDFGMVPEEHLLQEKALRLLVARGIPLERLRTTVMHATGQLLRPRRQTVQISNWFVNVEWGDVFEVICEAPKDVYGPVTVRSQWLVDPERLTRATD